MINEKDEKFIESALKLARRGLGNVEPNPAVGCLIVKAGQVIGRGWHKKFGGPHAEINALEDCKSLGVRPDGATMYVTLEPCSHQGKTGPCTEAIISAGLARVVIADIDPSEHASGKGIERLQQAGIEIDVGLCQEKARLLNAPFYKYAQTGKCWVVLKWAQSIDGKLAYSVQSEERRWISNELSRKDVHRFRRRVGAILVGINTVVADNPLLTPRPSKGRKPLRVVLDSTLRIPLSCRLLRTANSSPVIICTTESAVSSNPTLAERITNKGAEILVCPDSDNKCSLEYVIDQLSKRGVHQLFVEGGPIVLASFLQAKLADEVCVYIAAKVLGAEGVVAITEPMEKISSAVELSNIEVKSFDCDILLKGLISR